MNEDIKNEEIELQVNKFRNLLIRNQEIELKKAEIERQKEEFKKSALNTLKKFEADISDLSFFQKMKMKKFIKNTKKRLAAFG